MYVLAEHAVMDPDAFWAVVGRASETRYFETPANAQLKQTTERFE